MQTQLNRIHAQVMCNLIEMCLDCKTRLCCTMTTFGTTWRFVRKEAHPLELIAGELVCHCLQGTCIVSAGNAIGAIGTPIQKRTEMHSSERPVLFHTRLDPHLDRMAASMHE